MRRVDLITCDCSSGLTWPKYTIRLLQTVLQETQLLKLKPVQTRGLTYWHVTHNPTRPGLNRWSGDPWAVTRIHGSNSGPESEPLKLLFSHAGGLTLIEFGENMGI